MYYFGHFCDIGLNQSSFELEIFLFISNVVLLYHPLLIGNRHFLISQIG